MQADLPSFFANADIPDCRPGKEGKEFGVPLEAASFVEHIQRTLGEIQDGLFADAKAFRDANIRDVSTYDELKKAIAEGFWARGPWAGRAFKPGTSILQKAAGTCILFCFCKLIEVTILNLYREPLCR